MEAPSLLRLCKVCALREKSRFHVISTNVVLICTDVHVSVLLSIIIWSCMSTSWSLSPSLFTCPPSCHHKVCVPCTHIFLSICRHPHPLTCCLYLSSCHYSVSWIGWLNLFNAELSPKRHWWGPGSREVGEEGSWTVTTRMTCIKMGSDESLFSVSFIVRGKVTTPALRWAALSHFSVIHCEGQSPSTVTTDHNFWRREPKPKRTRTKVLLASLTPNR